MEGGRIVDSLLFAFRNIRRKRLRSLLTVAGIAIGVLSVVIVSIIGEVGKSAVNQELDSMGIGGLCLRATEENNDKYFTQSMLQAVSENENVLEVTRCSPKWRQSGFAPRIHRPLCGE